MHRVWITLLDGVYGAIFRGVNRKSVLESENAEDVGGEAVPLHHGQHEGEQGQQYGELDPHPHGV